MVTTLKKALYFFLKTVHSVKIMLLNFMLIKKMKPVLRSLHSGNESLEKIIPNHHLTFDTILHLPTIGLFWFLQFLV
jgi:hypothetical protein